MSRPIHICILTTAHPVDDVRVNAKIAAAFRRRGYRVTWVGPDHAFYDHTNYNRDGLEFVLTAPSRNRLDRLRAGSRVARLAQRVRDIDVYYTPEPDSAHLALSLAKRNGARVILDIHEVYHGTLLDRWLFGRKLTPVREWVRLRVADISKRCDLVIGVSEAVLRPYVSPWADALVIRSCAPSWFADGEPADVCGPSRRQLTLMHGKAAMIRGTAEVLRAIHLALSEGARIRVIMVDPSRNASPEETAAVRALADGFGLMKAMDLRRGIPVQEMPGLLRCCDVGMISYGRGFGVDSLPNRLFEYMAAGLPVLAPSYSTEIARIVEAERCGMLVDFEDPSLIASAILRLFNEPALCKEMGKRAREAFLARHNWEVEVRPLLDVIEKWFPDRRTPGSAMAT